MSNHYPLILKLGLHVASVGQLYGKAVSADDLEAVLAKAVKVTGYHVKHPTDGWIWSYRQNIFERVTDTHTGLLLAIEPIKPKCERHVPSIESKQVCIPSSTDPFGAALVLGCSIVCATCGVRLTAEWKEAREL